MHMNAGVEFLGFGSLFTSVIFSSLFFLAEQFGFTVTSNNNRVLLFGLSGAVIPPQSSPSPLLDLAVDTSLAGAELCILGLVRIYARAYTVPLSLRKKVCWGNTCF